MRWNHLLIALLAIAIFAPSFALAQSSTGGGAGGYSDELDRPYVEEPPTPEEPPEEPEQPEEEIEREPEVTYFENRIRTNKLLYIIDRSGSMSIKDQNDIVDGGTIVGNPTRLDVAKAETKRSISSLTKSIDFNVIAFASGSSYSSGGGGFFSFLFGPPPPPPSNNGAVIEWQNKKLVKADDGNKKSAMGWVGKLTVTGATDAKSAFTVAFAQNPRPEVMFFLSDGLPNTNGGASEVRSFVKGKNTGGKTQIHTIWIGESSASGNDFMSGLARDNKGTFTRK